MRFLIVPNYAHSYDQRMVRGLANALTNAGHPSHALVAPKSDHEISTICQTLDIDVLMRVNQFRPVEPPLPSKIRHISWFQDIFPETVENLSERIHTSDIVYTLGDPEILGVNIKLPCLTRSLVTGVDDTALHSPDLPVSEHVDFSLCGFIPAPFYAAPAVKRDILWYLSDLMNRVPVIGKSNTFWLMQRALFRKYLPVNYVPYAALLAFRDVVESLYRPLRGELDINFLSTAMRENTSLFLGLPKLRAKRRKTARRQGRLGMLLRPYSSHYGSRRVSTSRVASYLVAAITGMPERTSVESELTNYFAREYPRLLDRLELVESILGVSQSLELYGPGWSSHEQFKPFHKGVLKTQDQLLAVYRRTRINLANNTHGLGLHSRTLECMAAGGFIFTHASPNDAKSGGMHTSFEPGVHYGMFTPENLQEEAWRWLKDEKRRTEVGKQAAAMIREKHLWKHRAQQILDDLKQ